MHLRRASSRELLSISGFPVRPLGNRPVFGHSRKPGVEYGNPVDRIGARAPDAVPGRPLCPAGDRAARRNFGRAAALLVPAAPEKKFRTPVDLTRGRTTIG